MWASTVGLSLFGTLKHGKPDSATLKPAAQCTPIRLSKPDGKLTFDRLSLGFSLQHQPRGGPAAAPARRRPALQISSEHDTYAGPLGALLPGRRLRMDRGGQAARAT
jgi:electron-transferring-flavoprotein dehydrogenase